MTLSRNIPEVNKTINNILMSEYGTITSTLARRLGQENLNDIDKLVSSTIERARDIWSTSEIPKNPTNQLWQFITDNTSDLFCRKLKYRNINIPKNAFAAKNLYYPDSTESTENKLAMMFTCCHPSLKEETRIYLILKIMCGFTTSYIARLFSKNESAVADMIYEGKKSIIEQNIPMHIPSFYRNERLEIIQKTLYKIFENGINPYNEKLRTVPELCYISINLAKEISKHNGTSTREVYALIAAMLFRASTLSARIDEKGNVLSLKEQDRSLWDKKLISEALDYLDKSASGDKITKKHLEAGVLAVHSLSRSYRSTNWDKIIELYDRYLEIFNDTEVELERAIAVSKTKGPGEGIEALNAIENKEELKLNKLFFTTLGNLFFQTHIYDNALTNYREALKLTTKPNVRDYIKNKIGICEQRIEMTSKYRYGLSF